MPDNRTPPDHAATLEKVREIKNKIYENPYPLCEEAMIYVLPMADMIEIVCFVESQQARIEELEATPLCDIQFLMAENAKLRDTIDWIDDLAMSESFREGGDDAETRFRKIRECCADPLDKTYSTAKEMHDDIVSPSES